MPQGKKTLAELAEQFQIDNPILTKSTVEEPSQSIEIQIEQAEETELLPEPLEKTKLTWKENSWLRIAVVAAGLGTLGIILLGLLSLQLPSIENLSVSQVEAQEKAEEEQQFADDGHWVANAAYANQSAAFSQFDKETSGNTAKGNSKKTKKPTTQKTSSQQQSVTPPPVVRPVTASQSIPPPTNRIRVASRPSAAPTPVSRPPTRIVRPTVPPRPAPAPTPAPTPKRVAVTPPAPRPAPVPVQPPAPPAPQIDPFEQWQMASNAGVAYGEPSNIPEATIETQQVTSAPTMGIDIPMGTQITGQLATPIAFSENMDGPQTVLIDLDASSSLPAGTKLVASYVPADSSTKSVAVQLQADSLMIDGYEVPIPSGTTLMMGKKGRALIAKQQSSGGGFGQMLKKTLFSGGREYLNQLTQPRSQISTNSQFGSTQTTDFGDRNPLAGAGMGIANSLLDDMESRQGTPTLNGVWSVKPGASIEVHFLKDIFL